MGEGKRRSVFHTTTSPNDRRRTTIFCCLFFARERSSSRATETTGKVVGHNVFRVLLYRTPCTVESNTCLWMVSRTALGSSVSLKTGQRASVCATERRFQGNTTKTNKQYKSTIQPIFVTSRANIVLYPPHQIIGGNKIPDKYNA